MPLTRSIPRPAYPLINACPHQPITHGLVRLIKKETEFAPPLTVNDQIDKPLSLFVASVRTLGRVMLTFATLAGVLPGFNGG